MSDQYLNMIQARKNREDAGGGGAPMLLAQKAQVRLPPELVEGLNLPSIYN